MNPKGRCNFPPDGIYLETATQNFIFSKGMRTIRAPNTGARVVHYIVFLIFPTMSTISGTPKAMTALSMGAATSER